MSKKTPKHFQKNLNLFLFKKIKHKLTQLKEKLREWILKLKETNFVRK